MPDDDDPQHPVWSVLRPILEHQLVEICNLSPTRLRIATDVDTLVTVVVRGLAKGWDQKTLCKRLLPRVCDPEHRAIFEALASWVFATQGVLSYIYQPILSQGPLGAGHGPLQQGDAVTTKLDGRTWGPSMPQHSFLVGLPNELFDRILKCLPRQDVNDVRLTCRRSRQKSFDFWSRTFFKTRQFMIDDYSLQTLLDISHHPELRCVLTDLIIGVDEINTKDTLSFLHNMHATNPTRVAMMSRYWRDAAAAQEELLHTGEATKLLSQAISNLTELKAVSVSGSTTSPYVPSHPDMVHYPDMGLRSYGASAYQMQRRDVSDDAPNTDGFLDKVFNCVLTSLVRSSPEKLLTLRTNLDRDSLVQHLKDEAFYLPPFAPFSTGDITFLALTFLSNITELCLDVNLESRSIGGTRRLADHRHTFDPRNTRLRQVLCACYSLVSLKLSVYRSPKYAPHHCDFTAWLVESADGPSDTPVYWPFLRNLFLKGLYMSPANLRNIFVKFDTVTSATLHSISLEECFVDTPPIPHNSQDELENYWATFFRESAAVLSNLESLELHDLQLQRYRDRPNDGVGQIWPTDFGGIAFVTEAPRASLQPEPPITFTVTDFRQEALETLADQAWFLEDWERAQDGANAEADTDAED